MPYVMICSVAFVFCVLHCEVHFINSLLFISQVAATKGISQVVISRIVMCAPGMSKYKCKHTFIRFEVFVMVSVLAALGSK
jgi:hypothetical protein